jgi:glycosyltransferase involved in cell wall biosynthesis
MTDSVPTSSQRPSVLVLYEHGSNFRPYGSSFLRLIRPLTHPKVHASIDTQFELDYNDDPVDLVIIDRLWKNDVTLESVQELVSKIRIKGPRIIYSLDDNYFDLAFTENTFPTRKILPIVSYLLSQADVVIVTTPTLRQRLLKFNPNINIVPNQLDERLLVLRPPTGLVKPSEHDRVVVGYMGTFTHDEDLKMVLPALKTLHQRFPGRLEFQIVGVLNLEDTKNELQQLPVKYVYPMPEEHEYPLFMLWFTGHIQWDIAISPLLNTHFNACKSDIKFLDYASIGAAGIFSQSPAYSSTVQHQQNGWLAENTPEAWEQAIETLLLQPELRLSIARNAYRYLYTERILAERANDWVDLINSLCSS